MAIIKLGPDNFEIFTLATHPARTYSSSSAGVTGSVYVYARRSDYEKTAQCVTAFDDTKLQADSLEDLRLASINVNGALGNKILFGECCGRSICDYGYDIIFYIENDKSMEQSSIRDISDSNDRWVAFRQKSLSSGCLGQVMVVRCSIMGLVTAQRGGSRCI